MKLKKWEIKKYTYYHNPAIHLKAFTPLRNATINNQLTTILVKMALDSYLGELSYG